MAQETQIKVKIDDNEALQALREMAALVSQISDGLSGLKMAPDAVPSAPSGPSAPTTGEPEEDKRREQKVSAFRKALQDETRASIHAMTSPQTMSSLTTGFGNMLSELGKAIVIPGLGPLSTASGELLKMYGRSLEAREARMGEVLNLETLEAEMSGVIEGPARETAQARAEKLAKLGLDPTQTRQLMLGVAGATGLKTTAGDLSEARLMRLAAAERTGVSAQSIAGLAGALSQNIGESVGSALDTSLAMRNIAERQLDLRGSGVERFLGQLGGFVEGLTARGISARQESFATTLTGIRAATGKRGQRPMQIMQALSGVGAGAFSQISAPLQEIAQMSVFADIMSRSGDLLGAMEEAEKLQEAPGRIPEIIARTTGGGRLTQATIGAISGIGTEDALGLARGIRGGIDAADRMTPAQVAAQLNLNAQQAEQTRQTIRAVRTPEGEKVFEQMIKVSGEMERNTISMSENVKLLTNITDAQVTISSAVTSAVNGIGQALDKLSDYLP
jgi:hypothetical protein